MIVQINLEFPSSVSKDAIMEEITFALATAFERNTNPRFPKGLEITYEIEEVVDG